MYEMTIEFLGFLDRWFLDPHLEEEAQHQVFSLQPSSQLLSEFFGHLDLLQHRAKLHSSGYDILVTNHLDRVLPAELVTQIHSAYFAYRFSKSDKSLPSKPTYEKYQSLALQLYHHPDSLLPLQLHRFQRPHPDSHSLPPRLFPNSRPMFQWISDTRTSREDPATAVASPDTSGTIAHLEKPTFANSWLTED
jgi:hypothetical protein